MRAQLQRQCNSVPYCSTAAVRAVSAATWLTATGSGQVALWEKESHTGANQVLIQSAVVICIELGAGIFEESILDKRADLRREKIIGTSNHIPCQIRVT